ncbi:hypothetical protein LMH73_015220 [Vibrio splendidus]|nr:hypothetical protein [Vibrio splendidus]MCC4883242.1 hypothetical protein [Vibrio splendidus]
MNKGLQLVIGSECTNSNSQLRNDLESLSISQNLELHKIMLSKAEELMKSMITEGVVPAHLRKDVIGHLKALKKLRDEIKKTSSRKLKLIN